MAAKTPVSSGTTGFIDPDRGFWGGAISTDSITDGAAFSGREGLKEQWFYFSDIDNGDTWASGIKYIRRVAWAGDRPATDLVHVNHSGTSIVFITGGNDRRGHVIIWSGGAGS